MIVCVLAIPVLVVGSMIWPTIVLKRDARMLIDDRASLSEFTARFGDPMHRYQGKAELPAKLKPDVPGDLPNDWIFYYFGMEGLPSYWSILLADDPHTPEVDWGFVRRRP